MYTVLSNDIDIACDRTILQKLSYRECMDFDGKNRLKRSVIFSNEYGIVEKIVYVFISYFIINLMPQCSVFSNDCIVTTIC